ncbi:phosphatase domain-containing protein [Galactobacter caseinivorans]|uniref:Polynucleotide kinase n=1 Tax=Galactobacter caseinivorans TaxID=2676123 RepID=A0A496PMW5_9MICC|nr:polynucleotide kinase [Galactobacter caseinivorans]RKW71875.1 polynucleotide kinase [Galactobacter caseinivorans]
MPSAPELPTCWIFDMDGTLALMGGRSPYDMGRVSEDQPHSPVVQLAQALAAHPGVDRMVIASGRNERARRGTETWLVFHGIPFDALYMRPDDDQRRDDVVKEEILDREILTRYRVLGVVDDRQQVVDMWRRRGLTCLQAAPGDF